MLNDKVILVTGSSRGIGAATARLIKEYGGRPVLHGKDETDSLKNL
jgi:3-oxoacyl-[acyl-carrier protein] reductase